MNEIQLSDGTTIELTGQETPEEITSLKQKVADYEYRLSGGDKGLIGNIVDDFRQRQRNIDVSQQEYEAGRQTLPEYALQGLGQAAGSFGDVGGRVIGEAFDLVPDSVTEYVGSKIPVSLADKARRLIQGGADIYGGLKEDYPRAMRNVEAGANLAMLGAPVAGRAKEIKQGVTQATKALKGKLKTPPPKLSSDELRSISSRMFKEAEQKGGVLSPEITNKFLDDISFELPQTQAGKVLQGDTPVTKMLERANSLRNQPLTLDSAKEIDEILGELAYSNVDSFGKLDKSGMKFQNMQQKFREAIEQAPESMVAGGKEGYESLKEARKYWSTSLRLRDVERIIEKGMRAEQPATSIKNGFKTLLNSKKIKNYSPQEIQAIESAAEKGIVTDIVGTFGSRLSPQITGAAVFAGTTDPVSAAMAAGGNLALSAVSRGYATKRQLNRAKFVEDMILQRIGRFGRQNFKVTPEIKKLAKEAGIVVAPSGGVSAILDEAKKIQQLPVKEEEK